MNVIISNKFTSMLKTLDIEVIKNLEGVYDVDYIIDNFSNFYYQRMILDITSIKDYKNIVNLQKLSISIDMDKVILLLDDDGTGDDNNYLSSLISMGIYNFAKNKENILYLYNNPNSYRDVAHIHQLAINGDSKNEDDSNLGKVVIKGNSIHGSNTNTNNIVEKEVVKYVDKVVTKVTEKIVMKETVVIGVNNITINAGSTSLIYMMLKQLEQNYKVAAIEVDKNDFKYFNNEKMISTTNDRLPFELMKYNNMDIILVDLNNTNNDELCTEVLYLIEPSTIKLNKMMGTNIKILEKLKDKKVILNKSLLDNKDILDFEYESRIKIFFNMPPLDDRRYNLVMDMLLNKIGFDKQKVSNNRIFGMFKF